MGPATPLHIVQCIAQLAAAVAQFLVHSNYGPISFRYRDKWRFRSKVANFSYPVHLTPPLSYLGILEGRFGRLKNYSDGPTRW